MRCDAKAWKWPRYEWWGTNHWGGCLLLLYLNPRGLFNHWFLGATEQVYENYVVILVKMCEFWTSKLRIGDTTIKMPSSIHKASGRNGGQVNALRRSTEIIFVLSVFYFGPTIISAYGESFEDVSIIFALIPQTIWPPCIVFARILWYPWYKVCIHWYHIFVRLHPSLVYSFSWKSQL